jgi:hypothetical protein
MCLIPSPRGHSKVKYSSVYTTGKHTFAVRENLCRAFSIGRTTKSFFAVSLPCVFLAHCKQFSLKRHVDTDGEPLAPTGGGTVFFSLCRAKIKTHGKVSLPCVFVLAHGKEFSPIYIP